MPRSRRARILGGLVLVFLSAPAGWGSTIVGLAAGDAGREAADAFEPDNAVGQASTLSPGAAQAHTFHTSSDQDWARFAIVTGEQTFTLETGNLQFDADTYLVLLDQNGATVLAENDDSGDEDSVASRITYTYTAAAAGFLYVRVTDTNSNVDGAYSLTLDPGDAFEPDGLPAEASLITPGTRQPHTFTNGGDEDWAKFNVVSGRKYTVRTSHLGSGVDTIIQVYAADGVTMLEENDDAAGNILASRVSRTAEATGVYFVRVQQFGGAGSGAYDLTLERAPGVYLNADGNADVLTYSPSSGDWVRQVSNGSGGFVGAGGTWSTGWSVLPATFDNDALTDFLIFNATTGDWAKMLNDGASGFTTQSTGGGWPNWKKHVTDLDGDGISDVFMYDPTTGTWHRYIATPTGFTLDPGSWAPNWEIYPVTLNHDGLGDFFLINRTSGQWYWVLGDSALDFTFSVTGSWVPKWTIYPGDFDGDGRTDLFLYNSAAGNHDVAITTDVGFTYTSGAGWVAGWTPWILDLNGDGFSDLFLYSETVGRWFQLQGNGAGLFTVVGEGWWMAAWNLYATDLNADGRSDVLLFDAPSGVWYSALNLTIGSFTYSNGNWGPGLQVVVRPPNRPAVVNGCPGSGLQPGQRPPAAAVRGGRPVAGCG